jgi:hypothetical protein
MGVTHVTTTRVTHGMLIHLTWKEQAHGKCADVAVVANVVTRHLLGA